MCPIKGHLPQAVYCLLQVIILFASIITCSNINVTGKIKISGNTQEKKKKRLPIDESEIKKMKSVSMGLG